MPLPCLVLPECFWKCSFPFDLWKHNTRLLKCFFRRENIFDSAKKVENVHIFTKKGRKTSLIVEFIKKFLLKLHLQSSLGRGKSWFQWKNIFESKLEKNISRPTGKIFPDAVTSPRAHTWGPGRLWLTRQGLQTGLEGKNIFPQLCWKRINKKCLTIEQLRFHN